MTPVSQAKKPEASHGGRLARLRRQQQLTRKDVAARLGLSATDVKNIEQGKLELLPDTTTAQVALRHFALLLGENPADYQFHSTAAKTSPEASTKPLVALSKTTNSLLMLLVMVGVGGFLIWRIIVALALPELNVHQPAQGQVTTEPTTLVRGNSTEQAQVFVNDVDVPLNPDGSFTTEVILSPGPNNISIVAINSFGRQARQARTVIYQAP